MVAEICAFAVRLSAVSVLALSSRFDGRYAILWMSQVANGFSTRSVESF